MAGLWGRNALGGKMPAVVLAILAMAARRTSPGDQPVTMRIRSNLLWLTIIGLGGLVIFAALGFTALFRLEINGPVYRKIALSKDLVSDYVPPSQSLLEIARICSMMNESLDPAQLKRELSLFRAAQKNFEERSADYMRRVPEGKLKDMMRGTAYQTARLYIQIAQQEFIPLVRHGDHAKARDVLVTRMNPIYEKHAAAVDQIVQLANLEAREGEALAAKLVRFYTEVLIGGGVVILVAVGVLSSVLARGISKQTGKLIRSEERFRRLIEGAPLAVAIGRHGMNLWVNQPLLELFGYQTADEVNGHSIGELWAPESRALVVERNRMRSLGQSVPSSYDGKHKGRMARGSGRTSIRLRLVFPTAQRRSFFWQTSPNARRKKMHCVSPKIVSVRYFVPALYRRQ